MGYIFYGKSRIKDLRESKYGCLQPENVVGIKNHYAIWNCKCLLCGEKREVSAKSLAQGNVTMCEKCAKKSKSEKLSAFTRSNTILELDLEEKDFGFWHVVSKSKIKNGMYTCRCQCGKIKDVSVYNLLNGTSTSCGCANKSNIVNKEFGFLTAIKPIGNGKKGVIWECKCRCGNIINVPVTELSWKRSCGCMKEIEKKEHTKITWVTNGGQKLRSNNTSGISGVNRANGKWGARITFQGKVYWLGTYESKEDAIIARKTAENYLYADFLEWWSKKRKDDKNE